MRVLVAMSGGVDSSMVAKALKDEGHYIEGVYMMLHDSPEYHKKNIVRVKEVGEFLGIKTHVLDLQESFKKEVYEPFVETYRVGKTPNPCALCNRTIKLGALLEHTLSLGFDKLATGHYARIEEGLIKVAVDESKDQSYFLANVKKESLKHLLFPLGDKLKSDIKEEALKYPELIKIAGQKESSEICFVEKTYIDILNRHFDTDKKGVVKDVDGKVVGSHNGYMHYTIGKRRGFTVSGAHEPHYVLGINAKNNEIVVGTKEKLLRSYFETESLNEFLDLDGEFECFAKVRYRSSLVKAKVTKTEFGAKVRLESPVSGIAAGQLAVFYDDESRVLASGFIV
ncbi:MAG: tRNA 2-thiouridine(34) synthase MnmA [Campylobacteraceae bacterium]|nr:tRNA 2-thiouridine(34) synthase MnmA [Campylobacteraceae bacterium]